MKTDYKSIFLYGIRYRYEVLFSILILKEMHSLQKLHQLILNFGKLYQ